MSRPLVIVALIALAAVWIAHSTGPAAIDAVGEVAIAVFRPVAIFLLNLLNSRAFIPLLSGVILLAGIYVCFHFYRRVCLPSILAHQALAARLEPMRAGRANLEQIDNVMRSQSLLAVPWMRFMGQYRIEGRSPTSSFQTFIDHDERERTELNRDLYQAVPGYFTTVGLILTFAGLVAALHFASVGFRSGNLDEAKLAIFQLLNASAFKFLTSVAALLAAFVIAIVVRLGSRQVQQEVLKTAFVLDACFTGALAQSATAPPLTEAAATDTAPAPATVHADINATLKRIEQRFSPAESR